jgi:predicted DNA binding CopG/RHH family protein
MKNRKIIIRITESQLAKIVEETKRQKMNKSTLIREVLDEYFDQKLSQEIMDKYRVKTQINKW